MTNFEGKLMRKTTLTLACIVALATAGQVQAGLIGFTNDNSFLYSIDLNTGVSTRIGSLGVSGDFEAMAFDPTDGTLYMYDDNGGGLYSVDTISGAATSVGGTTELFNGGMSFNSLGQGYVVEVEGNLFSLNKNTGALSFVGIQSSPGTSAAAFVGNSLYAVGGNERSDDLLLIDITTGSKSSVGPLGVTVDDQAGLGYDGSTLYLLNESTSSLYNVNPNTGVATLIALLSGDVNDFESLAVQSSVSAVPEPSSLAIFGLGACIAGLGCTGRRKRKVA